MTTKNTIHDIGVASHIGQYSDAIESGPGRMLFTSGTPGLTPEGHLPDSFEEQADQAWKNILEILKRAHEREGPRFREWDERTEQQDIAGKGNVVPIRR